MDTMNRFSDAQLATLRAEFAGIATVNPGRLDAFRRIFNGCSDAALAQLAGAGVKFASKLAVNALRRRNCSLDAFSAVDHDQQQTRQHGTRDRH